MIYSGVFIDQVNVVVRFLNSSTNQEIQSATYLVPCSTVRCMVGSIVKTLFIHFQFFTGRGGGAFFVF